MADAPKTVVVETKPAAASKINWTSLVGILVSIAAFFGLDLSGEQVAAIILGIQAAQSVITMILRTFFTKTVTPASL